MSIFIPEALYEYYKSLDRAPIEDYSIYVTHPYDDEYISSIVKEFDGISKSEGYTEIERINFVIAFIHSLSYTSDSVSTPFDEYPRYPLETLVDEGGDCEDSSILAAALLDKLNYDVLLLGFPDHMVVGICVNTYGAYWSFEKKDYFYLETTGEGWEIGEIPPEFEEYEYANVFPLKPIPILTHDWTATRVGYEMTLTITIKNVGSARATGIRAYAAFDAGEDYVWNEEESGKCD